MYILARIVNYNLYKKLTEYFEVYNTKKFTFGDEWISELNLSLYHVYFMHTNIYIWQVYVGLFKNNSFHKLYVL